jgi:ABC-type nitrate/sulfonate/bicarbonate transport system substrate-binding protein
VSSSVAALKGKSVGIPFGTNLDQYGRQVLIHAGILSQVTLVNLEPASAFGALESGGIAAYVAPPSLALAWAAEDPRLKPIDEAGTDKYANLAVPLVYQVEETFYKAHPNIQKALWGAEQASQVAAKKDPAGFWAWYDKAEGVTTTDAKASLLLVYGKQPISSAGLSSTEATDSFLENYGYLTSKIELKSWMVGK